jgi:hypothetical protein
MQGSGIQVDPAPMKQVEALKMIEQERLTIEHHLAIHLVDAIAADIPGRRVKPKMFACSARGKSCNNFVEIPLIGIGILGNLCGAGR